MLSCTLPIYGRFSLGSRFALARRLVKCSLPREFTILNPCFSGVCLWLPMKTAINLLCVVVLWQGLALAQTAGSLAHQHPAVADSPKEPQSVGEAQTSAPLTSDPETATIFPHSESGRYWISGQTNIILQWHPSFRAKYTGINSLQPQGENATSQWLTLYTGLALTPTTELLVDPEVAAGRGLSSALGLAGFPNLDVVRNPQVSKAPYFARVMARQVIPLSQEKVAAERRPLGLATSLPARRLELRIGKFALVDFFDQNSAGSDSHLQFMNWTVDNNAASDYAANTRGYTDGIILEFQDRRWGARYAETLMPKGPTGLHLDATVFRAPSDNFKLDFPRSLVPH